MANAKVCRQCGETKPIEQFRQYYGGRKGRYSICKLCERINSRAKYLRRKGECMNLDEENELIKIEQLYDAQRAAGLRPPHDSPGRKTPLSESLDDMLSKYKQLAEKVAPVVATVQTTDVPAELSKWLTEDLTEEPEYYQDVVYEQLKAKYRPVTVIDTDTLLPVYDDTYKTVLDAIIERFDAYEDEYYNKED